MTDITHAVSTRTLRQHVLDSIAGALYKEGFPPCEAAPVGVLNLVDAIAAYYEEGNELFPHVIITTDLEGLLGPLPFAHRVDIQSLSLNPDAFARTLRLCAPLAVDGWVIFNELDIEGNRMISGLISAELSDTSPSLYDQLIGEMASLTTPPVIYLSNVGQRTVLIEGRRGKLAISLTLKDAPLSSYAHTSAIASLVCSDCDSKISDALVRFLEKHIDIALKHCHGTLLAIVKENPVAIQAVKELIPDGLYLPNPVDLASYFEECEASLKREAATKLRIYASIVRNMLRTDGITIFTTAGKVLAYHSIILLPETPGSVGGTRSRAYKAMVESRAFVCCYYRSQDGHEEIWRAI